MEFSTQPLQDVDIAAHKRCSRTVDVIAALLLLCSAILVLLFFWGVVKQHTTSLMMSLVTVLALSPFGFFAVYYGIIRPEENESTRPLDYEECGAAARFFEDHPEYAYFIDEVRRQGR